MSKHTQEPWRVGTSGSIVANEPVPGISGSYDSLDYGGYLVGESITPSNAERIAYCVNACAGISNEDLDDITLNGGMLSPRQEIAELAINRDELLQALKKFMDVFSNVPPADLKNEIRRAYTVGHRTIEKVEGK